MIPGAWNREREASNNQYDPGSVKGTLEEEMFPGGWSSQIEGSNTENYPGPIQSSPVDGIVTGRPPILTLS